jgi:HEAT repeat protein
VPRPVRVLLLGAAAREREGAVSKTYLANVTALTACVAVGAALAAQQPRISNGRIDNKPAGALAQTFRATMAAQTEVAWIGYSVPVKDRDYVMCCWTSGDSYISGSMRAGDAPCCGSCRLEPSASREGSGSVAQSQTGAAGAVKLEGPDRMVVLFRIVDRQVERVRAFSEDCELDAGGRAVHWLENVQPGESVALLESLLNTEPERKSRITNSALNAIARHAEPSAGAALERLATRHTAPGVRGEALFWLAQRNDASAPAIIQTAIDKDPASDVRKRAVFALSQLPDERGIDALIRVARTHTDPPVRGEAIFWLGQKAGKKAAGTITEAIEKDPETEVKRRAVFALSQLPKGEGVPLLIDIARKNTNPVVRKQAIFWLGQSKDPRAIEFFAEILK